MPKHGLDILDEHYDALLIANGTPPRRGLLRLFMKRAGCVIALDGGVNALYRLKIAPTHVVGDMDSADESALRWAKANGTRIHPRPSADQPDIAKGLDLCRSLHLRKILIAGCTGARLEHVLGCLHFVSQMRGLKIVLVTDEVAAFVLRGKVRREFRIPAHHTVSWFGLPEAGPCSLSGVKWPFRNKRLRSDGFHSLSNEPNTAYIQLKQSAGKSVFVISLKPQKRVNARNCMSENN